MLRRASATNSLLNLSSLRTLLRRGARRRIVCLVSIIALVCFPGSEHAVKDVINTATVAANNTVASAVTPIRAVPITNFDWCLMFLKWLVPSPRAARQETLVDRNNQVASLQVNPTRFVGYQGQIASFSALPSDVARE